MPVEACDAVFHVIKGAQPTLRDSLWMYWPTRVSWEVAEATPLAHITSSFIHAGWRTFAEVPNHSADQRADFLAMNYDSGVICVGEGKRLYNGPGAASLACDAVRLRKFVLPHGSPQVHYFPKNPKSVACIVATTWKEVIKDWWLDPKRSAAPKGHRPPGWSDLGVELKCSDLVQAIEIYDNKDVKHQQYLLVAAFSVSPGFTEVRAEEEEDAAPPDREMGGGAS